MMATQFRHNSFLYFKYIIRKGNGTFVSSENLKLQSFFILIPGSPKLPGPPKTFSFILYTYHSQNQRAKRTAKPFRPLILLFCFGFFQLFFLPVLIFLFLHVFSILILPVHSIQTGCRQQKQCTEKASLSFISQTRKTNLPPAIRS